MARQWQVQGGNDQMTDRSASLFRIRKSTTIADHQSSLTADEFDTLIDSQTRRLMDLGLGQGDRIIIYGTKTPSYCALLLAIFTVGAIAVPAFSGLKASQLQHIFNDCKPRAAFANKTMLRELRSLTAIEDVCFAEIVSGTGRSNSAATWQSETHVISEPHTPAAIIYTSGSTGLPKGVVFSRNNLLLGARSVAQYTKLATDDCILCVLPFSFDAGFISFLSGLIAGSRIVLADFVQPSQLIALCQRLGVTTITAVPGLWSKIVDADWSSASQTMVRLCNTGGHLHMPLFQKLQAQFPKADIYPMYGFTEAFRCAYMQPERAKLKPGSVGGSIPYASFAVISDDGRLCSPGEVGELVQFGPLVTLGYWHNESANDQKFRPVPMSILHDLMSPAGDIYRCDPAHFGTVAWSGDLMTIDENGDLTFVSRRDEMMKANGFRISPSEIETACIRHGCSAAFAFVFHHETQDVIAVACSGSEALSIATLESRLRAELPNYMLPHHFQAIDDVPTNGNGKFDRAAIRKILAQNLELQTC
jgi:acyl-CoA synthetase (AMP-forming)/AMP-acid ligase II